MWWGCFLLVQRGYLNSKNRCRSLSTDSVPGIRLKWEGQDLNWAFSTSHSLHLPNTFGECDSTASPPKIRSYSLALADSDFESSIPVCTLRDRQMPAEGQGAVHLLLHGFLLGAWEQARAWLGCVGPEKAAAVTVPGDAGQPHLSRDIWGGDTPTSTFPG